LKIGKPAIEGGRKNPPLCSKKATSFAIDSPDQSALRRHGRRQIAGVLSKEVWFGYLGKERRQPTP
jgi:hypothetical protein